MRALSVLSTTIVLTFVSASFVHAQTPRPGGERLGKVHFDTACAASVGEEFDHAIALQAA